MLSPSHNSDLLPSRELLGKKLPELLFLEKLLPDLAKFGEVSIVGYTQSDKYRLPLHAISFGSRDPEAPVLGLFGGVHGLERIGAQVCLALLKSFSELLLWDSMAHEALKKIRLVAIPMINPLGMMNVQRCNPNGVDLMRNAPVEAEGKATFLLGGQRVSSRLPWFRGYSQLEPENQAVVDFCKAQFFRSKSVITVDFHSGFGVQDQLWFPYAKSTKPFPHLPELHALKEVLDRTYPHHFYRVEPQAKNYTTHGDLWDYIYDLYHTENPSSHVYLPLALEMGSWMWVKKNPLQIFSPLGPYNPLKPHRQKRILRRHLTLFDFLMRSLVSPQTWASLSEEQRHKQQSRAQELWYEQ